MKRLMALWMATALLLTATPTAFAADAAVNYAVGDVSSNAYVPDEDGRIDLSDPVDILPYGRTVYFPLLNDGNSSVSSNLTALRNAQTAATNNYNNAVTAHNNAKSAYDTALAETTRLKGVYDAAKKAYDEAPTQGTGDAALKTKWDEAIAAQTANQAIIDGYAAKRAQLESELATLHGQQSALESEIAGLEQQLTALGEKPTGSGVTQEQVDAAQKKADDYKNGALAAAQTAKEGAQKRVDDAISAWNTLIAQLGQEKVAEFEGYIAGVNTPAEEDQTSYNSYVAHKTEKVNSEAELGNKTTALSEAETEYGRLQQAVKDLQSQLGNSDAQTQWQQKYDELNGKLTTAKNSKNTVDGQVSAKQQDITNAEGDYNTATGKKDALAKAVADAKNAYEDSQKAPDNSALKKAMDNALADYNTAKAKADTNSGTLYTAWQSAKTNMEAAEDAKIKADNAYNTAAAAASTTYNYVYESNATKSIRITKKWEENGSMVEDVSITRRKIASNNIPGITSTSMRNIYFLAIELDSSSSTSRRDLFGRITLKKSGTNGFETTFDVAYEMGYSSAGDSSGDGIIGRTAATFKDGDGFDAENDYEFEFEDAADSTFTVNTVGQGSIVLAFNTDYDEDIGDEYPDADLYFFNGNYANFNRTGTLFLSCSDDYRYLYSIDKSGKLTRVDTSYDDYDEGFSITTRTLGRYVASDTRLSISSASSSSSSSSSSRSSSSIAVVTPSSSSTAAGGWWTPSSSTAPPAPSSSSRPSSSSQPSSSSEDNEEDEGDELPIEDDEDLEPEDEIIDVDRPDDEEEPDETKRSVPTIVWVLLGSIVVAVPAGLGVAYYLKNRDTGDDWDYEDEDDDDYR